MNKEGNWTRLIIQLRLPCEFAVVFGGLALAAADEVEHSGVVDEVAADVHDEEDNQETGDDDADDCAAGESEAVAGGDQVVLVDACGKFTSYNKVAESRAGVSQAW